MTEVARVDAQMISALRIASKECSDRGLLIAAKWASELHLAIPIDKRKSSSPTATFSTSTPARTRSPEPRAAFPDQSPTQPLTQTSIILTSDADLEYQEEDIISAARRCMEAKEFMRAVNMLKECKCSKARFLRVYCRFIASEKMAQREWHKLDNTRQQPPVPVNTGLDDLLESVRDETDPWLLFLKALFLSRLVRREEAIASLIHSIDAYPWNWSAWSLLGNCIGDGDELSSLLPLLPLPSTHPLMQMFQVKTLNELHSPSENELSLCNRLLGHDFFPSSLWIMSLRACVLYHLREFAQAEAQFERILALDPYRIDDIDIFSNILYVQENQLKLSRLAHEFLALDKDRPEVCCLVGNHYSLRAEHEKAVKYFRRATQLDRTYLSAWTLMGHEYVEMKNSHAAIEAYRRAVDVNRKDYRAWYGLGQAYELLGMHQYALYYHKHATALRPYDVRLWQAQGMCYEELGRVREAIECFKRALIPADSHEININLRLARLYQSLDEQAEAIAYHQRVIEVCQADLRPIHDYAKSCMEVAEYQMRVPDGDPLLAHDCLERVATSNVEEVSRATELLKVVRARIQDRILHKKAQQKKGKPMADPVEGIGKDVDMVVVTSSSDPS